MAGRRTGQYLARRPTMASGRPAVLDRPGGGPHATAMARLALASGGGGGVSRDDDGQLRAEFMERLYEETEDPTWAWVDPEPIGVRIGIEGASTLSVLIEHLVRAGFVEKAYDDEVRLTVA